MHVYIHTNTHTHTHTHACICTHTHTHLNTYIHTHSEIKPPDNVDENDMAKMLESEIYDCLVDELSGVGVMRTLQAWHNR